MSTEAEANAQGTTGEPAPPEVVGSGTEGGSAEYSPEQLEFLKTVDPGRLPQETKSRFEAPFLSDHTRKSQALAEEKRSLEARNERLTNLIAQRLERENAATPDETMRLREELRSGNLDVIDPFVSRLIDERMDPVARSQAVETAVRMDPFVAEAQAEIAQAIQGDRDVWELARANNYALAPKIMVAVAAQIKVGRLEAKIRELEASIPTREAKAVADHKAKVAALPTQTSRAGSTPSVNVKSTGMDLGKAMRAAKAELGGLDESIID